MERVYSYRAVSARSGLLELAGRYPGFADFLRNFNTHLGAEAETAIRDGDGPLSEMIAELRILTERHPDIEDRYLCSVRTWDMLLYLICDGRRTGKPNEATDWIKEAVTGGNTLGEPAAERDAVKYLDPATVIEYSNRLSAIPTNTLIINWNPQAMEKAGVAESRADDGFDMLARVEIDFNNLKEFYWKVSEKNEGILAFCG